MTVLLEQRPLQWLRSLASMKRDYKDEFNRFAENVEKQEIEAVRWKAATQLGKSDANLQPANDFREWIDDWRVANDDDTAKAVPPFDQPKSFFNAWNHAANKQHRQDLVSNHADFLENQNPPKDTADENAAGRSEDDGRKQPGIPVIAPDSDGTRANEVRTNVRTNDVRANVRTNDVRTNDVRTNDVYTNDIRANDNTRANNALENSSVLRSRFHIPGSLDAFDDATPPPLFSREQQAQTHNDSQGGTPLFPQSIWGGSSQAQTQVHHGGRAPRQSIWGSSAQMQPQADPRERASRQSVRGPGAQMQPFNDARSRHMGEENDVQVIREIGARKEQRRKEEDMNVDKMMERLNRLRH